MKATQPRTQPHRHRLAQVAAMAGLGLFLLLNGPAISTAHPMGPGLGPAREPGCMPAPDGPMPPSPRKDIAWPEFAANPLRSVAVLPADAKEVTLQPPRYYFSSGLFYIRSEDRYDVVPPPPGAIIPTLPEGVTTLTIGQDTYFFREGVFYRKQVEGNQGYEVVVSPIGPPPMPPPPPRPTAALPDMVTLLLHQGENRTIPVVLKRHGHRWIGPKGEIYDRLPTEQQLVP